MIATIISKRKKESGSVQATLVGPKKGTSAVLIATAATMATLPIARDSDRLLAAEFGFGGGASFFVISLSSVLSLAVDL